MFIPRKTLLAAGAAALLLGGCATGPYYGGYGYDAYGYGPAYYDPYYAAPSIGLGYSYYDRGDRRHWRGDRDGRDWRRDDRDNRDWRPSDRGSPTQRHLEQMDRIDRGGYDHRDHGQNSPG